jgi:hypothetical protein
MYGTSTVRSLRVFAKVWKTHAFLHLLPVSQATPANPKDAISCILWYRYIYYKISTASDRFALKERKPSNAGRILLPILLVVVVVVAVVAVEYL